MAAELANMRRGDAETQRSDPPNGGSLLVSAEDAAKMMNVGLRSVERAKKRMHDDPAAHAAVKAGAGTCRKNSPE